MSGVAGHGYETKEGKGLGLCFWHQKRRTPGANLGYHIGTEHCGLH